MTTPIYLLLMAGIGSQEPLPLDRLAANPNLVRLKMRIRVGELLQGMSQEVGVPLEADPLIRKLTISLNTEGQSAKIVLQKVADACGGVWSVERDKLVLRPTSATRNEHAHYDRIVQDNIRRTLDDMALVGNMGFNNALTMGKAIRSGQISGPERVKLGGRAKLLEQLASSPTSFTAYELVARNRMRVESAALAFEPFILSRGLDIPSDVRGLESITVRQGLERQTADPLGRYLFSVHFSLPQNRLSPMRVTTWLTGLDANGNLHSDRNARLVPMADDYPDQPNRELPPLDPEWAATRITQADVQVDPQRMAQGLNPHDLYLTFSRKVKTPFAVQAGHTTSQDLPALSGPTTIGALVARSQEAWQGALNHKDPWTTYQGSARHRNDSDDLADGLFVKLRSDLTSPQIPPLISWANFFREIRGQNMVGICQDGRSPIVDVSSFTAPTLAMLNSWPKETFAQLAEGPPIYEHVMTPTMKNQALRMLVGACTEEPEANQWRLFFEKHEEPLAVFAHFRSSQSDSVYTTDPAKGPRYWEAEIRIGYSQEKSAAIRWSYWLGQRS